MLKTPTETDYLLHGKVLESVICAKNIGTDISSDLSWNSSVDRITGNVNRTLGNILTNMKIRN